MTHDLETVRNKNFVLLTKKCIGIVAFNFYLLYIYLFAVPLILPSVLSNLQYTEWYIFDNLGNLISLSTHFYS